MDNEHLKREAWRLIQEGNYEAALNCAQKARNLNRDDAEAHALVGDCNFSLMDLDGVIEAYTLASQIEAGNQEYYFALARAYYMRNDLENAEKYATRATKLDQNNPDYRVLSAAIRVDKGEVDEGLPVIEEHFRQNTHHVLYRAVLADAYIAKAYQGWLYIPQGEAIPSGMYAPDVSMVNSAEIYKEKAESLQLDTKEYHQRISELNDDIRRMKSFRIAGHWWLGLLYIWVGMAWGSENILAGAATSLLGILFIISCVRTAQTHFRHRALKGEASLGRTLGYAAKRVDDGRVWVNEHGTVVHRTYDGWWRLAIWFVLIFLVTPIAALWNFNKNYVSAGRQKLGFSLIGVTCGALFVIFAVAQPKGEQSSSGQIANSPTSRTVRTEGKLPAP